MEIKLTGVTDDIASYSAAGLWAQISLAPKLVFYFPFSMIWVGIVVSKD